MATAVQPTTTASIRDIIESRQITAHFQPIVSARQRTIMGLEALARSPHDEDTAHWLFQRAATESLTAELEELCCEAAVNGFAGLPDRPRDLILFVNVGALLNATDHVGAVERLQALVSSAHLSADKVAVELLEAKIDDIYQLRDLVGLLRRAGFLLVLDDVGTGHSNLDRIPLIQPDILKVDRSLIARIADDFHKQETLKSLVGLSRKIGALVVAEGVETEDEAIVALELGADLMQGYFLSRPSVDGSLGGGRSDASVRTESLAQKFKRYMVGKINDRKLQYRRFNIIINEVLCHLASAEVDRFDEILQRTVCEYPNVECMYVLDNTGIQVTATICNPGVARRERGMMFRPASRGTDHSLKEYYYILLDVELPKYTTDPYVSCASGNICRTISTYFRDAHSNGLYVLCIDVVANERTYSGLRD